MALHNDHLRAAAKAVGTPLYAYSADLLRARVQALRTALPAARFVYSLKANPNLSVVRCLTGQGVGAEICSAFEMETCIAAGVAPEDMIFVGPAKSKAEINRAVQLGLKAIIAESLDELAMIDLAAARVDRVQAVALRINPDFHTPGAKLSMSGKPTQFGMETDDLDPALDMIRTLPHIRLAGLHVYMGTRILDHGVVAENTRNILELADELISRAGHGLDFVDIGGGYGVPYHDGESPLDLAALGQSVNAMITDWQASHPGTRIIIELGRYMVAEAGSFVTAVRFTKTSKGKRFAICDGGSNCHAAAAQSASFRRNFPIAAVAPRPGAATDWFLSGPLCTPTDVIAQNVALGDLHPGDLIRIDQSGAYGPSASNVNFLSFGPPAEVMIDGDTLTVIRERGTLAAHLDPQTPRAVASIAFARPLQKVEGF